MRDQKAEKATDVLESGEYLTEGERNVRRNEERKWRDCRKQTEKKKVLVKRDKEKNEKRTTREEPDEEEKKKNEAIQELQNRRCCRGTRGGGGAESLATADRADSAPVIGGSCAVPAEPRVAVDGSGRVHGWFWGGISTCSATGVRCRMVARHA